MLDRLAARAIAQACIDSFEPNNEFTCVIVDEWTVERPGFFVFLYESDRHLATGSFSDRLVGNAPILVNRLSGEAQFLGTANSIEHYIEQFEKTQ